MEMVATFTNLQNDEASGNCPVLGINGRTMRLKLPRYVDTGSPVKVEVDDTLSLGEVSCCRSEADGYVVSVEMLQALHHVDELTRLARALLA
jgi:hypothetical protein